MNETDRHRRADGRSWRIGYVSYLNALPLVDGLRRRDDIELLGDVPARLPAMLDTGAVDVALVPVIDLFRHGDAWRIVSDGCIGSDGETLTVRIFSQVPAEQIRTLHVDIDSHTSIALATVLWAERFGTKLELVPHVRGDADVACEALLLIGDKVVVDAPTGYPFEVDLGEAWRSLTSLPFVFAVWAAPACAELGGLPDLLAYARDAGVASARELADAHGSDAGWPIDLARQYLTATLQYQLTDRHRAGMDRFRQLAARHHLVPMSGAHVAS